MLFRSQTTGLGYHYIVHIEAQVHGVTTGKPGFTISFINLATSAVLGTKTVPAIPGTEDYGVYDLRTSMMLEGSTLCPKAWAQQIGIRVSCSKTCVPTYSNIYIYQTWSGTFQPVS